ncbi:universal stress protein [Candidatus Binatus sp.]|jgi:universal stress protein A|uniref:universal stress protein n=1 Tax=Candidatus Binatus sp. TaxID=2811406 RepID=UPI003BCD1859
MAAVFSRILCPIDFERDSMDALELACRLAKQNSATVYLLTVIGAPPAAATALPPVALNPNPEFEAGCLRRLEAIAREKLAGVPHEIFVATGNAAPEILNLTAEQDIDLLVMGTHGRTGLKHFLLGSVAERVVRESPVPVLTIHPKAAA